MLAGELFNTKKSPQVSLGNRRAFDLSLTTACSTAHLLQSPGVPILGTEVSTMIRRPKPESQAPCGLKLEPANSDPDNPRPRPRKPDTLEPLRVASTAFLENDSSDPRKFNSGIDILKRINDRPDIGSENRGSVSVAAFPSFLEDATERIKERKKPEAASKMAIYDYAAELGKRDLEQHPDIQLLRHVKTRLRLTENNKGDAEAFIMNIARSFNVSLESITRSQSKRVWISKKVNFELSALASDLGASAGCLFVICLMVTYCTQPCVNEERKAEMAEHVSGFLRQVRLQARALDALINRLLGDGTADSERLMQLENDDVNNRLEIESLRQENFKLMEQIRGDKAWIEELEEACRDTPFGHKAQNNVS